MRAVLVSCRGRRGLEGSGLPSKNVFAPCNQIFMLGNPHIKLDVIPAPYLYVNLQKNAQKCKLTKFIKVFLIYTTKHSSTSFNFALMQKGDRRHKG